MKRFRSVTLPGLAILTLLIMGVHGGYDWWLYLLVLVSNLRWEK